MSVVCVFASVRPRKGVVVVRNLKDESARETVERLVRVNTLVVPYFGVDGRKRLVTRTTQLLRSLRVSRSCQSFEFVVRDEFEWCLSVHDTVVISSSGRMVEMTLARWTVRLSHSRELRHQNGGLNTLGRMSHHHISGENVSQLQ